MCPGAHHHEREYEFDDAVTAPLNGFSSANRYYEAASCKPYLAEIRKSTHILYSLDDPFFESSSVPDSEQLPDSVTLELSEHGGHVGFVEGGYPGAPSYWLDGHLAKLIMDATR